MRWKERTERLRQRVRRYAGGVAGSVRSAGRGAPPADQPKRAGEPAPAGIASGSGGLHAVTGPVDAWFTGEVEQLEREARESGAQWAQAGLPRSDAPASDELPPEQALRRRASELFTQWVQSVTTRLQDTVETNVQAARQALNDMAFSIEEIRGARPEIAGIEQRVASLEAANRGRHSTFGFRSYWQWWWFVPAIVLLVAIDWVANVPVFQELLPQDADISGAWQVLAAEAELHGALAGLYRMWYRIALSPEVALLALGVIVFLVVLAHIFGESVRRIIGVSERDVPEAGRSVRQYRRQFWVPAAVGLVGGIAVITFLFLARQEIASFAEARLTDTTAQLTTLDEQIGAATAAGNINEVARLSALRPALEDELRTREERRNYADRIQATNVPIAILNSVLFLTAALLGYLKLRDEVTAADPQDPRLIDLMRQKRELRASMEDHRRRVRDADQQARHAIAWAEFLAQSKPFEDWEGRRERLARVTSVFRGENARLRGIDPQNIAAFRSEPRLDVAVPDAHGRFRLPNDFGAVKERHLSLVQEWRKLEEAHTQNAGRAHAVAGAAETGRHVDA